MGWGMMDTAPRDGTWVLLLCIFDETANVEPVVARWRQDEADRRNHGPFGPFGWQAAANGDMIAERVPVRWCHIPSFARSPR